MNIRHSFAHSYACPVFPNARQCTSWTAPCAAPPSVTSSSRTSLPSPVFYDSHAWARASWHVTYESEFPLTQANKFRPTHHSEHHCPAIAGRPDDRSYSCAQSRLPAVRGAVLVWEQAWVRRNYDKDSTCYLSRRCSSRSAQRYY